MKKQTILTTASLAAAAVLFSGCGIKTNEYSVSADNVSQLRTYEGVKLNVGEFTAKTEDESHITCRLSETITTPQGESFEEYIKNALISELKLAGLYDSGAELTVTGRLERIYGSSVLGNAYWEFETTVHSSNGESISVKTRREYPSSYFAATACNNMATSFSSSVRKHVGDMIGHKDFAKLLR